MSDPEDPLAGLGPVQGAELNMAAIRALVAEAEEVQQHPDVTAQAQRLGLQLPPDAPPEFPEFEPTELALADAARSWIEGRDGFIIHDGDSFLWFDGDRLCRESGNAKTQELFKSMVRQAGPAWKPADHARMGRRASISGAMSLAASALAIPRSSLDTDDWLLPCPGGVTCDLTTGKVRRSTPADRMTKIAGVAPDFSMPIPNWIAFLVQVGGGDEDEFLRLIQVLFGYLLTGSTKEQRLFYIVGRGGTGKSTLVDIIRHVLGDFAVMTEAATFAEQRHEPHPAALAALDGRRAVFAPEFEGRRIDASKTKAFTGDGAMSVRGLYEKFRQVRVTAKLIMVGNSEPQLRTVDEAIRRRFVLIPFNSPPPKVDLDLPAKLRAEAPGILAWAIRGAQEWVEEGLYIPASIAQASAEYLDDQDSFGSWIAEHVDLTDRRSFTASAELFAHWRVYAEAANDAAGTAKAFGSRLRKMGLQSGWTRVNGKSAKGWTGCKLRSLAP
jgi:P4 family phage/plasmid primase-like protien